MPPWPRLQRQQGTQAQHHHLRAQKQGCSCRQGCWIGIAGYAPKASQKSATVPPKLLTLRTTLAASPARFAATPWAWEDLHPPPGVLSGLPGKAMRDCRHVFRLLLLLFLQPILLSSPPSKLLQTIPPSKALRQLFIEHSDHPSGAPPHPTSHAGITALKEIKGSATTAGNPARQAEGFTLRHRLYLSPRRISLNPLLYFPSLPSLVQKM